MTLPAELRSRTAVVLALVAVGKDRCTSSGRKLIEGVILSQPAAPVRPNAVGLRDDAKQVFAALGR